MILTCNSCNKKFVVPDSAITATGRTVQCGSCGNKWKQYPEDEIKNKQPLSRIPKIVSKTQKVQQKIKKTKKVKKILKRKSREINLYSPEYLAKKHGIKLSDTIETPKTSQKASLGFYGSFIILIVLLIVFSRSLYFFQDYIVEKLPVTEFYLEYFFESVRNLFEIWKNLISDY